MNKSDTICNRKCHKTNQCKDISDVRIKEISLNFSNFALNAQNQFITDNVRQNYGNKQNVWEYYLDGRRVCKQLFLRAINHKSSKQIERLIKRRNSEENVTKNHWKKHNEEFDNKIKEFIVSFNPQHNHYNIANAPNKRYIHNMYSFKLYKQFAERMKFTPRFNKKLKPNDELLNCKNENRIEMCSYNHFNRIRKQLNVGFIPKGDLCKKCALYNIHMNEVGNCDCDDCGTYEEHEILYTKAREHMNRDALIGMKCKLHKMFHMHILTFKVHF